VAGATVPKLERAVEADPSRNLAELLAWLPPGAAGRSLDGRDNRAGLKAVLVSAASPASLCSTSPEATGTAVIAMPRSQ